MADNSSLHSARNAKFDDFYTRIEDVEEELKHYTEHFKNKIVLCNCDDSNYSAFWKYFHIHFSELGLKKLISTHYEKSKHSYRVTYTGGNDTDVSVGEKVDLEGNGDFRSQECKRILESADIVVTNPPFSCLNSFILQLIEYNKKFLIIGNINAALYKGIFPLIMDNKIWLGVRSLNKDMYFNVSEERQNWLVANKKEGSAYKIINDTIMGRLASACWFTNLNHHKRDESLQLTHSFVNGNYAKYDKYDAINVDKVANIPYDYEGIMGVPITYLGKHNSKDYRIVGEFSHGIDGDFDLCKPTINGKEIYKRIAIQKIIKSESR